MQSFWLIVKRGTKFLRVLIVVFFFYDIQKKILVKIDFTGKLYITSHVESDAVSIPR